MLCLATFVWILTKMQAVAFFLLCVVVLWSHDTAVLSRHMLRYFMVINENDAYRNGIHRGNTTSFFKKRWKIGLFFSSVWVAKETKWWGKEVPERLGSLAHRQSNEYAGSSCSGETNVSVMTHDKVQHFLMLISNFIGLHSCYWLPIDCRYPNNVFSYCIAP